MLCEPPPRILDISKISVEDEDRLGCGKMMISDNGISDDIRVRMAMIILRTLMISLR